MDRDTILKKLLEIHQNQAKEKKIDIALIGCDLELSKIGFDSLDFAEIIAQVEEEFDCVIRMDNMLKIKTINDIADFVMKEISSDIIQS
ncbi:MAG: acyl carrier protein [Syntrophomonas sp.]